VKLAFVILSHRKPDRLFERFLGRLSAIPGAEIGLHHDFGQSDFPTDFARQHSIRMVEDWMPTQWAHNVPATLKVFRMLFEQTDAEWFLTVSPNCYPLVSAEELVGFFDEAEEDVFMSLNRVVKNSPSGILRNKYRFLFSKRVGRCPWISRHGKPYIRDLRIPISRAKTPFAAIDPFQGSDWFAMNRKTVRLMLDAELEVGAVSRYLEEVNSQLNTLVSSIEMVIQTFVGNHPGLKVHPNNLRFIDWKNAKNYHPNTLTMDHWAAIQASDALFARKFAVGKSDELLDRIDGELLGL
jgi:hypothetical protein